MLRTLFLQAPSFDGFDGGAGSRYQAKREIKSFWFPTWLAQPAALVEEFQADRRPARRYDAGRSGGPGQGFRSRRGPHLGALVQIGREGDRGAEGREPAAQAGLIGAKVAVNAEGSLREAPAIDYVARNEFDFTIKDVADDIPLKDIRASPIATHAGAIVHNDDRPMIENMDSLPFVTPGLQARSQNRGLLHRLSEAPLHFDLYGPRLQIALHLLPVAADGRRAHYRTRSVEHVIEEIK